MDRVRDLETFLAIIASILTLGAIGLGYWFTRPSHLVLVITSQIYRSIPFEIKKSLTKRKISEHIRQSLTEGVPSVAQEYAWLSENAYDRSVPFLPSNSHTLEVAQAYRDLGNTLSTRTLVNAATVPFFQNWATTALGLFQYIIQTTEPSDSLTQIRRGNVARKSLEVGFEGIGSAPHRLLLAPHLATTEEIRFLALPQGHKNQVLDIQPVLERSIVRIKGRPVSATIGSYFNRQIEMETDEFTEAAIKTYMDEPHRFDGVLARLSDYEIDRNPVNGAVRLRISIGAVTYSAVVADHYHLGKTESREASGKGTSARLLTCSSLPVTSDGYIVLVRRSTSPNLNMLVPAVNGNIDMLPRNNSLRDSDPLGFPSPKNTIARETSEEIGSTPSANDIWCTSLCRISNKDESNTFLLTFYTQMHARLSSILDHISGGDMVEGRWEHAGEFWSVKLPDHENQDHLPQLMRWIQTSSDLAPHARACIIGIVSSMGFSVDEYVSSEPQANIAQEEMSPVSMDYGWLARVT